MPQALPTLPIDQAVLAPGHWLVVLLTLCVAGAAVVLHYEVLLRLNSWLLRSALPPRLRVLAAIFAILLAHVAEIWLFALGIWISPRLPGSGSFSGVDSLMLLDAVYLSADTFTTVGYGDLVAHGAIRMLLGSEALTGFVLITWSASFTYLEMQRFWRR